MDMLLELCFVVRPKEKVSVVKKDPTDNKFLECALAANADYIMSGDKHLLELREFRNIKIIRTWEILKLI